MSGSGRVLQAGLKSRPDDGRELLAVMTDGEDGTGMSAFWLDPDAEVPPDGTLVSWDHGHAWWTRPGGGEVRLRKRGFSFDPDKRELG